MSDSMHFRVFACCKRFDGTVSERGKAKGLAGTNRRFPRSLTSRGSDQSDPRGKFTGVKRGFILYASLISDDYGRLCTVRGSDIVNNKKDIMVVRCGEQAHAQEPNESRGTKFKHGPQLLFRLREFLLPGFPYGRVACEVVLTIVTANEVHSRARTVSKKQAVKKQRGSVQELQTGDRIDEQFW